MTAKARFITLEGGEGSGKSTLIAGLYSALRKRGLPVVRTREPGGTPLAEQVRSLVLSPPDTDGWSGVAEALLMNAARADHVEKLIAPALERGEWVLCDRFADSTLVYQGLGGVSDTLLKAMQADVTKPARPDLTFVLDAPAEALLERRKVRGGETDKFESQPPEFHERVRQGFLKLAQAEPDRIVVLDALSSPDVILELALKSIDNRLTPS